MSDFRLQFLKIDTELRLSLFEKRRSEPVGAARAQMWMRRRGGDKELWSCGICGGGRRRRAVYSKIDCAF